MKLGFEYNVTQTVKVVLDTEDVTEEYLKAFSEHMWEVTGIEDIAEYIARQHALYPGYEIEFAPDNYSATVVDENIEEA